MTLDDVAALHSDYRILIDFWRARKPADKHAPYLRGFELMEIYPIASRLVIVDSEPTDSGVLRYRWRYAGSELRNFIGLYVLPTLRVADEDVKPQNWNLVPEKR